MSYVNNMSYVKLYEYFYESLKIKYFFAIFKDEFETPKIIKKCLASFYILLLFL